jgi:hypothetical protein
LAPAYCTAGTETMPPMARCFSTNMTRFIPGNLTSNPPAIYAIGPDMAACAGNAWTNLGQSMGVGWACIAARAEDTIGNVGVSPAIRVCFSPVPDIATNCPMDAVPTCMDSCTEPPGIRQDLMVRQF